MRSSSRIRLVGALAALGAISCSSACSRLLDLSAGFESIHLAPASFALPQTSGTPSSEKPSADPPSATTPPTGHEQPRSSAPVADDPANAAWSEQPAIETVLNRYRTAFNSLDAAAVAAVWPGVDVRTLSSAFDNLAEQQFEFRKCQVWLTGLVQDYKADEQLAVASCSGTARFVPKAGAKTPRVEPRTWTFKLSKGDRGWLIYNVETRDGVSVERGRVPGTLR
jgi:hypothetical protein